MIELYSGTPGSGKSLHSAYRIIDFLRSGRPVIANFDINLGYFKKRKIGDFVYVSSDDLRTDWLRLYAIQHLKPGREHQALIVIDECAMLFNSRAWNVAGRSDWISFFQEHRKMGYDVILVSQSDRLIDRQIRAFIETEFKHRAITNYKTFGFLLSHFVGGLFVSVEYWYGVREKCGCEYFRLNKRKARIYNTYEVFSAKR